LCDVFERNHQRMAPKQRRSVKKCHGDIALPNNLGRVLCPATISQNTHGRSGAHGTPYAALSLVWPTIPHLPSGVGYN
jgi:hypothetical protein